MEAFSAGAESLTDVTWHSGSVPSSGKLLDHASVSASVTLRISNSSSCGED